MIDFRNRFVFIIGIESGRPGLPAGIATWSAAKEQRPRDEEKPVGAGSIPGPAEGSENMPEITETFFAADRKTWRAWLKRHHRNKGEIWLLFYKKHTGRECVSYPHAVEEALCFGWIDGILKRIDGEKHVVRFTPRRPGSRWSECNKERVGRMRREGRMTPSGQALVDAAVKSGEWARRREYQGEGVSIPDLDEALEANPAARKNFAGFPPSARKMYRAWILDAKREATRRRRIASVVERAAAGRKPGID